MTNKICKRCGRCCYYLHPDGRWLPCRYLKEFRQAKDTVRTWCAIYDRRIGIYIGYGQYCHLRTNQPYNIPDCPYNEEGKPDHPFWTHQKVIPSK